MTRPLAVLLLAAVTSACGAEPPATAPAPVAEAIQPAELAEMRSVVQADLVRSHEALYSGDAETLLSYTHPAIIEAGGGMERMRAGLAQSLPSLAGITVESYSFPEPPDILRTEFHDFAIIPTLMVMRSDGQKVESLNFQLGSRPLGQEKWGYMEGARIDKTMLGLLFPDFPRDYEFPEHYQKKLP